MTGRRRVRVTIDRVVLSGVPALARAKVAARLKADITAALSGLDGAAAAAVRLPQVRAQVPRAGPAAISVEAGAAVAGAVRRALNGGGS